MVITRRLGADGPGRLFAEERRKWADQTARTRHWRPGDWSARRRGNRPPHRARRRSRSSSAAIAPPPRSGFQEGSSSALAEPNDLPPSARAGQGPRRQWQSRFLGGWAASFFRIGECSGRGVPVRAEPAVGTGQAQPRTRPTTVSGFAANRCQRPVLRTSPTEEDAEVLHRGCCTARPRCALGQKPARRFGLRSGCDDRRDGIPAAPGPRRPQAPGTGRRLDRPTTWRSQRPP